MNTRSKARFVVATSVMAMASTTFAQAFFESGNTGTFDTSTWTTDRFTPGTWQPGSTDPIGGQALKLGVSNADRSDLRSPSFSGTFYNTQGRTQQTSLGQGWEVGGELYIPTSWSEAGNLRRSDLWTRDTNTVENNASYPIIGFTNANAADPFNPAAPLAPRFRVWDSSSGWIDSTATVNYDQYNSFKIKDTGSSYEYYINGVLTQTLTGAGYSQSGAEGLSAVFLEAYNFGDSSNVSSLPDSGYDTYWRNVYAVPSPGSAALLSLSGLTMMRRRRR
ncbi:MAG: hypothetical protein WC718_09150 [Phycisphaerales bacterium]